MAHYRGQKNGIAEWEAKKKKMENNVFFKKEKQEFCNYGSQSFPFITNSLWDTVSI